MPSNTNAGGRRGPLGAIKRLLNRITKSQPEPKAPVIRSRPKADLHFIYTPATSLEAIKSPE